MFDPSLLLPLLLLAFTLPQSLLFAVLALVAVFDPKRGSRAEQILRLLLKRRHRIRWPRGKP